MKVLIIGGGGREHALAWKAAQPSSVEKVFVAPGNAGTHQEPKVQNVAMEADDISGLCKFAREEGVSLTVVGPEGPLVAGLVDEFQAAGLACFGPTAACARLEGSKAFAKEFLARHAIPTAEYKAFTKLDEARAYIRRQGAPIVVKADGLAAGKGVVVAATIEEAEDAAAGMLRDDAFGPAGRQIVVEECLRGEEASFIVILDGDDVLPLATSQDHKARDDGDRGPNTGGMGAYSPAPVITGDIYKRIMDEVISPTARGLKQDGMHYTGFLYAGLMIMPDGTPKVLEFNCRFGDPETQPIMMRLRSDLTGLCMAALGGTLSSTTTEWDRRAALGIVMAAGGYPGDYRKGDRITGLPALQDPRGKVFHAGTKAQDGQILTAGGRVLCVVALGQSVTHARNHAYEIVGEIRWDGAFHRSDIGYRAIEREISGRQS